LQNTLWWQIATQNQLDPYILYAIALVESAKGSVLSGVPNHVAPWPWALNKSGKSIIPASQQEARTILNKTIAEGSRNIDVGLMQINLHWQGHRVDKPEQLLNPVTNLQIGALVLAEAIQSVPKDLVLGIGRYHSWQNVNAAVAYGKKVLAVADKIRTVL
jgi:soluble lytic murein transglycosylase-like protein